MGKYGKLPLFKNKVIKSDIDSDWEGPYNNRQTFFSQIFIKMGATIINLS